MNLLDCLESSVFGYFKINFALQGLWDSLCQPLAKNLTVWRELVGHEATTKVSMKTISATRPCLETRGKVSSRCTPATWRFTPDLRP